MSPASILKDLTLANIKMFLRDKGALFWSLFFPVVIITIFGVLDFTKMGSGIVGLVYSDETKVYAEQVKQIFEQNDNYKFQVGSKKDEIAELENDDRLLVLEFAISEETGHILVNTYMSKQNEQAGAIVTLITEKVLADISLKTQNIVLPFEVHQEVINTNNLRYIDYMVPGIVALSLMQGSLFGVINIIVVNREKGILRRIFATPLSRSVFLISNILARMLISLAQITILLTFCYLVFHIQIVGSLWLVAFTAILGSLAFLALGLLFSGFAKTSDSAQAMIMPIQMLFMFTSGVYFDRSVLPSFLYDITSFFPLTYLSDVLRDVMVKGYGLEERSVYIGLVAISIWLIVLVIISIKTFRWEIE